MKHKSLVVAASVALLAIAGSVTLVAQQVWTYKCSRCGLIQSYSSGQVGPRCPQDGSSMFLVR